MSQVIFADINPAVTSGTQLATYLNAFKAALLSGLSGSSRPAAAPRRTTAPHRPRPAGRPTCRRRFPASGTADGAAAARRPRKSPVAAGCGTTTACALDPRRVQLPTIRGHHGVTQELQSLWPGGAVGPRHGGAADALQRPHGRTRPVAHQKVEALSHGARKRLGRPQLHSVQQLAQQVLQVSGKAGIERKAGRRPSGRA